MAIELTPSGDQIIRFSTDLQAGRLLLHWGVEGGKDYKGGWRLPDSRPEGTVQYKDRALQSPWRWALYATALLYQAAQGPSSTVGVPTGLHGMHGDG